jgi:hypothetical protein
VKGKHLENSQGLSISTPVGSIGAQLQSTVQLHFTIITSRDDAQLVDSIRDTLTKFDDSTLSTLFERIVDIWNVRYVGVVMGLDDASAGSFPRDGERKPPRSWFPW